MNIKKLAILLGITTLCSFANATATVTINGAQTSQLSVDTPEIQTASGTGAGAGLSVSLGGPGAGSSSSSSSIQVTQNPSTANTKITTNNKNQGSYQMNVKVGP